MRQRLIKSDSKTIILAIDLKIGELGRIVNGHYSDLIITRMYDGFVCVYSDREEYKAFDTSWKVFSIPNTKVELLKGESVLLYND